MPAVTADDLHSFDDLLQLDRALIARGLNRVNWNDLVYAYIGAGEEVQRRIRRGMSGPGGKYLENIAANWGPVDPSAFKITQARILEQFRAMLRQLAAEQTVAAAAAARHR